jgi:hypothetical protein
MPIVPPFHRHTLARSCVMFVIGVFVLLVWWMNGWPRRFGGGFCCISRGISGGNSWWLVQAEVYPMDHTTGVDLSPEAANAPASRWVTHNAVRVTQNAPLLRACDAHRQLHIASRMLPVAHHQLHERSFALPCFYGQPDRCSRHSDHSRRIRPHHFNVYHSTSMSHAHHFQEPYHTTSMNHATPFQ